MQYNKFIELLNKGETKNIDFKIKCYAFIKGHEKDTAELIKDIIALSNNGNTSNYLIIGVSDDKTGFLSVDNDKLTDDNLQNLCKDNIFPIPHVKLNRCNWSHATNSKHKGKQFIIIQIGPQARQCFRFSKDFIDYEQKYYYRKHEVWIRRGATSDLASPEEVGRLLEGREPIAGVDLENNFDYTRVDIIEARRKVLDDLKNFIESRNGEYRVCPINNSYQYYSVLFSIENIKLRLGVFITDKCTKDNNLSYYRKGISYFDNGLLLITIGNISAKAREMFDIDITESWGKFCIDKHTNEFSRFEALYKDKTIKTPLKIPKIFCIVIDKIVNTSTLINKMVSMVNTIREKEDIRNYISASSKDFDNSLFDWKDQKCPEYTGKHLYNKEMVSYFTNTTVKELNEGEFIDRDKYKNQIMINNNEIVEFLNKIL